MAEQTDRSQTDSQVCEKIDIAGGPSKGLFESLENETWPNRCLGMTLPIWSKGLFESLENET